MAIAATINCVGCLSIARNILYIQAIHRWWPTFSTLNQGYTNKKRSTLNFFILAPRQEGGELLKSSSKKQLKRKHVFLFVLCFWQKKTTRCTHGLFFIPTWWRMWSRLYTYFGLPLNGPITLSIDSCCRPSIVIAIHNIILWRVSTVSRLFSSSCIHLVQWWILANVADRRRMYEVKLAGQGRTEAAGAAEMLLRVQHVLPHDFG